MTTRPAIVGIAGWKNSGKTTVVTELITALRARGYRVSTVKHAHHSADVDRPDSDTGRHRTAGASEVAIVTQDRWAIMHETPPDEAEASLADILARLTPVDIVIVEGYKAETHRKIEVQRADANSTEPLWKTDSAVIAVVNPVTPPPAHLASFAASDIAGLTAFIIEQWDLAQPSSNRLETAAK